MVKTIFECELPFPIKVESAIYPIKLEKIALLKIKRIMKATVDGEEVDIEYDSRGVVSNSIIKIIFPWKIDVNDKDPYNEVKIEALKYINRLIEVYRNFSEDCSVPQVCYLDIPNYNFYYIDNDRIIG